MSRRRALALSVLLTILPLAAPAAWTQDPATGLSLEDLDALLDEDASEAQPPSGREIASILGLVAVLGLAMFSFFKKSERLKTMALVASVAYLGFYKASIVSIVNFFSVIDGNFPTFRYSIPLYLLIGFTLVSTILWGRLYCGRICAFGALTQLLDKIVPSKWRIELQRHRRGAGRARAGDAGNL